MRQTYEHALVVLSGALRLDDAVAAPGHLIYIGVGRDEFNLTGELPTRALLVGGVPMDEPVLMWWNFAARSRDEIIDAHADWSTGSGRFGDVASTMPRVEVGPPPWTRR